MNFVRVYLLTWAIILHQTTGINMSFRLFSNAYFLVHTVTFFTARLYSVNYKWRSGDNVEESSHELLYDPLLTFSWTN